MNTEEYEIPVPWGHIAAKAWGDKTNPIILTFHGLMDNAASFDHLIPLLPRTFYYICIDHLGHGKSSHSANSFPFYDLDMLMVYRLIVQHFKQEKYIIIAHSFGGQIAMMFAQLYPEMVKKLILLDGIYPYPTIVDAFKDFFRDRVEMTIKLFKLHEQAFRKPPSYTPEVALNKMLDFRLLGHLTRYGAEPILERGTKVAEDGKVVFTVDKKFGNLDFPFQDMDYVIKIFDLYSVDCPVLLLLSRESKSLLRVFKPLLKVLKKRENFKVVMVNGTHDVHNNDPKVVVPFITDFLLRQEERFTAKL